MSITRECDACGDTMHKDTYIELQVRVLKTNDDSNQDSLAQFYGDYCDKCLADGKALKEVMSDTEKYRTRDEPNTTGE